jgi:hypothetical protein
MSIIFAFFPLKIKSQDSLFSEILKPASPFIFIMSIELVPKAEVLEQPQYIIFHIFNQFSPYAA